MTDYNNYYKMDEEQTLYNTAYLVLIEIVSYLIGENKTLFNLIMSCQKFAQKRHIFLKGCVFDTLKSRLLYEKQPKYWNQVHTLYLYDCQNITDVSALGHVHTLKLWNCEKITDVSALGQVHTLILEYCRNITDVSALGQVHTLHLRYCVNITDVSALGQVHTLEIYGCQNLTDVSALKNVKKLIM